MSKRHCFRIPFKSLCLRILKTAEICTIALFFDYFIIARQLKFENVSLIQA